MCVLKISCHFVIFAVFFVSLNGVLAKRGCNHFGHSCYGGHGKRSQGPESFSLDKFVEADVSRHSSQDHEVPAASEQFSNVGLYESVNKPDQFTSLLRKLAKYWEEQEQLQNRNYQRIV